MLHMNNALNASCELLIMTLASTEQESSWEYSCA